MPSHEIDISIFKAINLGTRGRVQRTNETGRLYRQWLVVPVIGCVQNYMSTGEVTVSYTSYELTSTII